MAFLKQTARQIWDQHGKSVRDHMFLFPSRRSMLYFKRAITDIAGQNLWMPECLTLEQWLQSRSDFILADSITSSFKLYVSAKNVGFTENDFETFYPLSGTILNDFDEVDMALIDPNVIWKHTSAWQSIPDDVRPPDVWSEMTDSSLKERWVINWNKLNILYNDFVSRMAMENLATKGKIYRDAILHLANGRNDEFNNIHVIGFSNLTMVEVKALEYFTTKYNTSFYWNVLPEFKQPAIDAGKNIVMWADYFGQDLMGLSTDKPEVEVISTSGMVSQIKTVSQLLDQSEGDEDKMAVLLPHPSLIDVFLTSFPDNRSKVNISLGYPLVYSTAKSLMEWILSLWETMSENNDLMNRTDLERIWSHLYIATYFKQKNIKLPDTTKLYYRPSELCGSHEGMDQIYAPLDSPYEAIDRLIAILEELTPHLPQVFHREILRYVMGRLTRLNDVLYQISDLSFIFLKRIIIEVMQTASVPFRGEPMEGVQVLGVKEVQNLEFETLIIPGMNEEVLPTGKLKSLIPFSLRRHYKLQDLTEMHIVQSYYIWSAMLQARRVYLLNSQGDDMLGAKGLSRYIFQLKYGSKFISPVERYLDLTVKGFDQQPKEVLMNDADEKLLQTYLKQKGLSPSALISYITCPFQFFLRYVYRIREKDDIKAGLDYRQMGTVIHDVMSDLYKPYLDKELSSDDIKSIKVNMVSKVQERYQGLYPEDSPESLLQGQHWIEQEIIIRAVSRFLDYDKSIKALKIMMLEADLEQSISTDHIEHVKLYGKIDRLDQKKGVVYRIIDYKTGTSKLNSRDPLAKLWANRNPAHNWQVLFYAYLIKDLLSSAPFEAGHYTLKDKNLYVPLITNKNKVHSETELNQFEEILKEVIDEMVNPELPFTQTENVQHCKYCAYNTFCERQASS